MLLVLTYLALSFRVVLPVTSLISNKLVFSAVPTLIHLLHMVLVLRESSLVIVHDNLLFRAPILVCRRLLAMRCALRRVDGASGTYVISGGAERLIVDLAIVAITFLLLGLHCILLRLIHLQVVHFYTLRR